MKKFTKLLIALLSLVMITCIGVSVAGCGKKEDEKPSHVCESICSECGKCTNVSCKEDACKDKCEGHVEAHKCSTKCSVCGKCLDYDCTEDACKDKCGLTEDKTTYVFEGEDFHVIRVGGVLGSLGTAKEEKYGATETYVSNFNANLGASITFNVYVESATMANLFVSVCKRTQPTVFTNNVAVIVNKTNMLDSPSIVPANGHDYDTWTEFVDVNLGCVELTAGKNEIKLSIMDAEATAGYNVNNISIKSSIPVSWYEGAHECGSVCSNCGKCIDYSCNDSACADKCEEGWTSHEFSALSSNAIVSNATEDSESSSLVFADNSSNIQFKLLSSQRGYASLSVVLEKGDSDVAVSSLLSNISLNGNKISNSAVVSASEEGSFVTVKVGYVILNLGANVVYLAGSSSQSVKVKGIVVNTTCEVEWFVNAANYIFEAEDAQSNAWEVDQLWKVGLGTASGGKYVGHVYDVAGQGYYLLFTIYAQEDCEATLYLGLGAPLTFSSSCLPVTVNGTDVAFDITVASSDWTDFVEHEFGTINLQKGNNTIRVEIGSGACTNVDYLGLYCEKTLSDGEEVEIHTCQSKCSVCGKCINSDCLDEACTDKCQGHDVATSKYKFEAEDAKSNAWEVDTLWKIGGDGSSGDKYVGHIGDVAGQGYYLSFEVYAQEDCTATLIYCLGTGCAINSNVIGLTVNDSEVVTDVTCDTGGWLTWGECSITTIALQEGKNTITLTFNDGALTNMDYLALECTTLLSATAIAE